MAATMGLVEGCLVVVSSCPQAVTGQLLLRQSWGSASCAFSGQLTVKLNSNDGMQAVVQVLTMKTGMQ